MESGVGSSSNLAFLGTYKCKGQLFVISIFSGCSLEDIFLSLSSKYEEINPLSMSLQYLAPQHKMYVTLNDNDDVRNMIHLHMCMKLSVIELRAELKDQIRGGFNMERDYGVELEYRKVWKGKELAMHDIYGTEKDCYDKLRCGFATGCRPMIFLDDTHIKNKYKGSILVAVGKEANDDLFTLAYSVVDAENDCNWEWFCINLRSVLLSQHISGFENFTFFSDRHFGIIKAVNLLFSGSHHAYCLRHLVDNFVKQVMRSYPLHNKKHWSSVFKKAAYAPSHQEFMQHINNISESMPLARKFITNSEPESWANALFRGKRWGVMNNNMAESWNNWVKPARYLPIVGMVDRIRVQIMNIMHQRRETTLAMVQELSPKKEKTLTSTYIESRNLIVHRSCGSKFDVVDGDKSFAVYLCSSPYPN
ncbi:uncharacterized protein [Henckelia pumila]|uniref:uncharacterized protein n=1 Tax=Henckelia pumila TaxID=405737 RepID=UPI003C6E312F